MKAMFENNKVLGITQGLVGMRSVDTSPNSRLPINHPIPNFPNTPNELDQLSGMIHCTIDLSFKLR
jgi:hypothetical protein